MLNKIELCFIPETKYIKNINSKKGKANIFYEIETTNKYDNEAIAIYTLNQKKEKIFLGYIKKNEVETIFTDAANELYEDAERFDNWQENKLNKNWAEVKEKIKTPIFTKEELEKIKENINNNLYNFRFEFEENIGYLFLKEK